LKSFILAALACVLAAVPALGQTPAPSPQAQPTAAYPGVIRLAVDVRDVNRRIFRVRETIPVARPGPMTLLYPQWLPGNHAPTGQLEKLAGLTIRAGGRTLPWRRDPINLYAFQVDAPAGAREIEVQFEFLSPTTPDQGGRIVVSPELLDLQWQAVVLYPAGYAAGRIAVEPSVRLPDGWSFATALEGGGGPTPPAGAEIRFARTDLDTLVDSPLYAGRHFRRVELDGGPRPVRLNIFADAPEFLEAKPEQLEAHRALVRQADALFGPRRFEHYDFLLHLTRRLTGIGLEHLESSENTTVTNYFTEWDKSAPARSLLPHEYTHSWNGKFMRPLGLTRADFNTPVDARLLWLYEGQTDYWGVVLAARAGLITADQARADFAGAAATYADRPGRTWRSVEDTTADPAVAYRRPKAWPSWQRGTDYYVEGGLVWLEADTLIRELSGGRRSLDDFARAFFGGPPAGTRLQTYGFEDIVRTLNAVQPYDWAGFLQARFQAAGAPPPLEGIRRGGYRLAYGETPLPYLAGESGLDLTHSLGMSLRADGGITSVQWDGPAFREGLAVGGQVLAVGGLAYDAARLRSAIRTAAGQGAAPLELLVRTGDHFRTVRIAYTGGLRFPRLERVAATPARLDDILRPR